MKDTVGVKEGGHKADLLPEPGGDERRCVGIQLGVAAGQTGGGGGRLPTGGRGQEPQVGQFPANDGINAHSFSGLHAVIHGDGWVDGFELAPP